MIVGLGSISACAFGDGGPRFAGVSPIGNTYARRGGEAECFRFCRLVQAVAQEGNCLDGFHPTCFDFRAGSLNWPFLYRPLPCPFLHEFTNSTLLETRGLAGWAFFEVRFFAPVSLPPYRNNVPRLFGVVFVSGAFLSL
jgi:hypothetical protein